MATTIIYDSGAPNASILGNGWEAHRWLRTRDTQIVEILWDTVRENTRLTLRQLEEKIKEAYKNKKVRSDISIYSSGDYIEAIQKGVMPNIFVEKKN